MRAKMKTSSIKQKWSLGQKSFTEDLSEHVFQEGENKCWEIYFLFIYGKYFIKLLKINFLLKTIAHFWNIRSLN